MAHSSTSIWIHSSWYTWEKFPLLTPVASQNVYKYLSQELNSCGCTVKIINGSPHEVHCLFLLNPKKSLDDVIKMVKGVSSHRINQENITSGKFAWQKGYTAYAVSEALLERKVSEIKRIRWS